MNEDNNETWRSVLWGAGGCVIVGFFLMIRYWMWQQGGTTIVPGIGWWMLFGGIVMMGAAVEPEYGWWSLGLLIAATLASYLGAGICLIAYLAGIENFSDLYDFERFGKLVNRGFGVIFIGYVLGALANTALLRPVIQEFRAPDPPEEPTDAEDTPAPTEKKRKPGKRCPKCGQVVPKTAAACQHCKTIFADAE